MTEQSNSPLVSIWMGSANDWPIMRKAAEVLRDFNIPFEVRVISAHRTPDAFFEHAKQLEERGVLAAKTTLPVLGVPINATALNGIDALYSIVQMPRGIPVATFAVGEPGAANAALFAAAILAGTDAEINKTLKAFRQKQAEKILSAPAPQLD